MLSTIAQKAFRMKLNLYAGKLAVEQAKTENGVVAVFGHGWAVNFHYQNAKEEVPNYVDWILARLSLCMCPFLPLLPLHNIFVDSLIRFP